jgi:hypothetical protein
MQQCQAKNDCRLFLSELSKYSDNKRAALLNQLIISRKSNIHYTGRNNEH